MENTQTKTISPVTRPQLVAVTTLSLVILAGGVLIAALFGDFGMRPMERVEAYVSDDTAGLPEARESQTVELKDGDSYDLSAAYVKKTINGISYRMLAYNGSIPGPLIKVVQGAEVTINFTNDTDMKTLLHSHGVRMDNPFDGSQTSQKEMEPGETFAYTLKFPDAGLYWYHPHVREDFQQELGLYGGYLVTPSAADYWPPVNREVPLFLDDILIEDGEIRLSKDGADRTMMGRFGNVMLVNGDDNYRLDVKRGEVVRFYVTNVANARPLNFAIGGARMKLVGADSGAYEKESWAESVLLGPSERAVVEVLFDTPGTYAIQNTTPGRTYTLGKIVVSDDLATPSYAARFPTLRPNQETIASIDPLRSMFNRMPDKRIRLTLEMGGAMPGMPGMEGMEGMEMGDGMMGGVPEGGIEWEDSMPSMNAMSNAEMSRWKIIDEETGKEGMDIDWRFKQGGPVKVRIFNDPKAMDAMQHPIHFHGQRFLVVARNGVPQTNLAWKDTVFVKAGETVDIVLDTSNPGVWMAHCHIAEHLEAGMMMKFEVK